MQLTVDEIVRDVFLQKQLIKKNFNCLEIGSNNFRQTKILLKFYKKVYCINPIFKKNYDARVEFKKNTLENYVIPHDVKDIFLVCIIEHLTNLKPCLKKVIRHLKNTRKVGGGGAGNLFIIFNNKYSFHRILGYQLGLIKNLSQLTKKEKKHGHNFILDEIYLEKFFFINKIKFKKKYFMFKPMPTHKMKYLIKKKNFKKFIYPKILEKNSGYIFYKCSF
jgi:hypothetical protein